MNENSSNQLNAPTKDIESILSSMDNIFYHIEKEMQKSKSLFSTDTQDHLQPMLNYLNSNAIFPSIKQHLRDYQLHGVNWLCAMHTYNINGILADEMGLGKTIQILSFLMALHDYFHITGPHLIVVPLSVLNNWSQEIERFASNHIVYHTYYGTKGEREQLLQQFFHIVRKTAIQSNPPSSSSFNRSSKHSSAKSSTNTWIPKKVTIVLTTYEMIIHDSQFLKSLFQNKKYSFPLQYLIVDEGHRLKDPTSILYELLLSFTCQHRLLLTGTPIQNNLQELLSLLRYLIPNIQQWSISHLFEQEIVHNKDQDNSQKQTQELPQELSQEQTQSQDIIHPSNDSLTSLTLPEDNSSSASSLTSDLSTSKQLLYHWMTTNAYLTEWNLTSHEEKRILVQAIHRLVKPFLLRRTKADVAIDLPPKIEKIIYCPMTSLQLELYSFLTQYYRQIHPQPTTATSTAPSSSSSSSSNSLSTPSNHFIQDELKHLIENEFSCVDSIDSEQKTPNKSPMKSPLQQTSTLTTTPLSTTKRIKKEIQMLSTSSATYYHSTNNLNQNNTNYNNNNNIPSEIKFKSFLHSNNLLLQLRKLSNHPYLILTHLMNSQTTSSSSSNTELNENKLFDQYLIESCGKLQMLDALLTTLLTNNINKTNKTKEKPNKILIYSQMTTTLDLLESYLLNKQIEYLRLDGDTNKLSRDQFLFDFHHNEKICVFLLSTRAGGIGINLQIANTVILYDTDWNPMQDEQAIARVHRLGQHSTVLIVRLLSQGPQIDVPSVEEYMLYTAQKKRTAEKTILSNQLFAGNLSNYSENNNTSSSASLSSNNPEVSLDTSYSFPSEQTAIPLEIDTQNQYLQTIVDRSFSSETNTAQSKNPIPITCYRIQFSLSPSSTSTSSSSSLVEAWKEYLNRMQSLLQPSLLSTQITDGNNPSPLRITRQLQRKAFSQYNNPLSDKNLGLNDEENKTESTLEIGEEDDDDDSFLIPNKKKRKLPNPTKDMTVVKPHENDSDSDYQLEAEEAEDDDDDNGDGKRKKPTSMKGMKIANVPKKIIEINEEDICVLCQHPWISSQDIDSFCQLHQWDSSNPKYHDKDWLSTMIICDACEGCYHLLCVGINEIPAEDWYCSLCQRIQHHSPYADLHPELLSLSED